MENAAHFIGTHALLVFGSGGIVMLALIALLWRLLERYGEALWRRLAGYWRTLTSSAAVQTLIARIPPLRIITDGPLTAGRYLGLHGVIGFLVALLALGCLFELADDIGLDEELGRFDHALAETLGATLSKKTYHAFRIITQLGDVKALTALGIAVALALLWQRRRLLCVGWVLALAGNGLLVRALKALFQRARPLHEHSGVLAEGWSFPSGHSAGAMAAYGMLAYLLVRSSLRAWHLPITLCAIAVILLVGSSRIFLQVHFFSDVMAGYCTAAAWLAICIAGTEIAQRHRPARGQ